MLFRSSSDCYQRTNSIVSMRTYLGDDCFDESDTRPFSDILRDLTVFKKRCADLNFSRENTRVLLTEYDRLSGTQLHYQLFRSQKVVAELTVSS